MPIYRKCTQCGRKVLYGKPCECRKDRYKEYDKKIRYNKDNKKYSEFYDSMDWKTLSSIIKSKYNGLCLMCLLKYEHIIPSDVTHHIIPIREDYSKRLEEDNLIPLCHRCHNNIDHINYTEEMKSNLKRLLKEYEKKYI